jgi:hypothetical protein
MWYINAFSFHPELGFAMLDEVAAVRTIFDYGCYYFLEGY